MHQLPDNRQPDPDKELEARVETLAAWLEEIAQRVQVAELASGDEKTAKELRKAIEALAKHDPKLEERLTHRVDVVAERLATMAATVSTTAAALAKKDGEIANLRRELAEENAKIETLVHELRRPSGAAEVEELRKTVAALEARERHPRRDDGGDVLAGKVNAIAQRLDMFATTLQTTAAGLAGREGELAALRRKLEDEHESVESALAEIRRQVDPTPVADLMQAVKAVSHETSAVKRAGQRALDAVSSKVETLASRLDSISQATAARDTALASHEAAVASLRAEFDSESTRVDGVLVRLHHVLEALSSRTAAIDGLAERAAVEEVTADVERLAAQLGSLGATVEAAATAQNHRDRELGELSHRLDTVDQVKADVERLAAQLGSLGATVEAAATAQNHRERELGELGHRLDTVDQVKADVERLATQLGSLGATVEEAAAAENDGRREQAELSRRFHTACARVDALVGELRTALETVPEPAPDPELGSRLDALEEQIDGLASELAGAEARRSSVERDELHRLLALLDERLDGIEQGRASLAADLSDATDLWSSNLGSLEARLDEIASNARRDSGNPFLAAGEGRLRVELRALELRLENAEALARDNREAVLLQLERLASHIEWRLQHLEAEHEAEPTVDPSYSQPETLTVGAQVVPIRGTEA